MKKALVILGLIFLIVGIASAGTISLTWDAPTTYTDGSPLPLSDLSYIVGWGPVSRGTGTTYPHYVNVPTPGVTPVHYSLASLATGTWFVAVQCVSNASGDKSVWSNEIAKYVPGTPGPPTNLTVVTVSAS
jgi:hypothetical protein